QQDQSRRVALEVPGVGRKPPVQHVAGAHPEVDADQLVADVEGREEAAEVLAFGRPNALEQCQDPRPAQDVHGLAASELLALPGQQLLEDRAGVRVPLEAQGSELALDLARLAQDLIEQPRPGPPPLRAPRVESPRAIEVRRALRPVVMRRERLLLGEQVIEVPGRQAAAVDQLHGVPLDPRRGDHALEVRDLHADREPDVPARALEGEESDGRAVPLEDGHLDVAAHRGHRLGELRSEVRAVEPGRRALDLRPDPDELGRQGSVAKRMDLHGSGIPGSASSMPWGASVGAVSRQSRANFAPAATTPPTSAESAAPSAPRGSTTNSAAASDATVLSTSQ